MALNLQDKQAIVAEVSEVAKGALSAVVADSRGVTVDKMTELRKAGRECSLDISIIFLPWLNMAALPVPPVRCTSPSLRFPSRFAS